jgi:lipoprotein-releasing system permease protein
MFELTIALRYLIPRKKSVSTALISLLSVVVISVVVWLILVFLSVTAGIERNWLSKLTALYSPIRLTPTEDYYRSYYYQIDSLSAASNYTSKTIGEKARSLHSDPYSSENDVQVPPYWPLAERSLSGLLRDPVKETLTILDQLGVGHQDYEIGGALLRLNLAHPSQPGSTVVSQMSYLMSFMDRNPRLASLIMPPSVGDINSLLHKKTNDPSSYLASIFSNISVEQVETASLDLNLLSEQSEWLAFMPSSHFTFAIVPRSSKAVCPEGWELGRLVRTQTAWHWVSSSGKIIPTPRLQLDGPLTLQVTHLSPSPELSHVKISVRGALQERHIENTIEWNDAAVSRAKANVHFDQAPSLRPPWAIDIEGRCELPNTYGMSSPLLLPKSYRDMGACIGDNGYLSFSSSGASAQEQRLPVQAAGFYDPGLFSMGGRCLIVPQTITQTIHTVSQTFSPDGTPTNGINIWTDKNTDEVRSQVEQELLRANLQCYWKVATYKDYEFSKELFQQFQSDRTLFLMIALLILLVACCNVISLLILLVNDKKREIAILRAMGASGCSVAAIFGCSGLLMGTVSCIIGTIAAIITLDHLDAVIHFLSVLEGHAAFQPAFFGQMLPNQLSREALVFVIIATPLLSLCAGLIPAWRSTRIRPSIALRQE